MKIDLRDKIYVIIQRVAYSRMSHIDALEEIMKMIKEKYDQRKDK